MNSNNLLNQSRHNIDRETNRVNRNLLVRLLLFMTSPKSLSGLLVFGILGLFFDKNFIYQISYGTIICMYLIPVMLYFSRDIIDVEDLIVINVPKFNFPKVRKKKHVSKKNKENVRNSTKKAERKKPSFGMNSYNTLAVANFKFMDVQQKQPTKKTSINILTGKKSSDKKSSSKYSKRPSKKQQKGLSSLIRQNY